MTWNLKAACGNSIGWCVTTRQCVAIKRNGLEVHEKSKEWPVTSRECVEIERKGQELQGSAWKFTGIDWHCKTVHGNS